MAHNRRAKTPAAQRVTCKIINQQKILKVALIFSKFHAHIFRYLDHKVVPDLAAVRSLQCGIEIESQMLRYKVPIFDIESLPKSVIEANIPAQSKHVADKRSDKLIQALVHGSEDAVAVIDVAFEVALKYYNIEAIYKQNADIRRYFISLKKFCNYLTNRPHLYMADNREQP